MDQATYREVKHFRPAILKESGEQIFVDDVTFDPAVHEEIPAPEAPAAE